MAVDKAEVAIQKFSDAAYELAESVKRNIQHEGVIDDETIVKLNNFIIASNAAADLLDLLDDDENETNKKLN